jgi:hypothetical protein
MKKIAFTLLFCFFISSIFSQDTIIKLNNDTVLAKIIQISPEQVTYKKFNFQDGPSYVIEKSGIKMILYSNGMKESFDQKQPKGNNPAYQTNASNSNKITDATNFYYYHSGRINENNMQKVLLQTNDPEITQIVNNAKKLRRKEYIGFAFIPLAVGGALTFLYGALNLSTTYTATPGSSNYSTPPDNSGAYEFMSLGLGLGVVGITCPIISSISKHKKIKRNSEAIALYNQKF